MRVEYLSDNVGDLIRRSERSQQRAARAEHAWAVSELQARQERAEARRRRPLWRKVLGLPADGERQALAREAHAAGLRAVAAAARAEVDVDLSRQQAGQQGERELELGLASLGDDWLLFRGYLSQRGEADGVLLGPQGLWVVEVKRRSVHLSIDGRDWKQQRVNQWARATGPLEPAVAGGGRTWGEQVGTVADSLTWWLERNHQPVPVRTAVLVLHERARVIHCVDPGVDLVGTSPHHLLAAIAERPDPIDAGTRDAVARAIRDDHQHRTRRRARART